MLRILTTSALAALLVSGAAAQRKPDPKPDDRPSPYEIDYQAFRDAYVKRQQPTVLILCGWSSGEHQVANAPTTGLFNLDTTGLTFQLRSAFQEVLNPADMDLDIVDFNALKTALQRLSNVLELRRERDAAKLLANELSAELVLMITLLDYDAADQRPHRLIFEAIDLARGRTLMTFPFQWELDTDVRDIKTYAVAIASKFTREYVQRATYSQRFTVRLKGLEGDPRLVQQVRQVLEGVKGVAEVQPRGISSITNAETGRAESLAAFELRYDHDFMSLASDLAAALDGQKHLVSEIVDMTGNTMTLNVARVEAAVPTKSADRCQDKLLLATDEGREQRRLVKNAYVSKDSPSIAVMVNRAPTRLEREAGAKERNGSATVTGEAVVVVNAAGWNVGGRGDEQQRSEDEEARKFDLQRNLVEEAIYNRLGSNWLDFTRIDPGTARGLVLAALDKERSVFREDELVTIMSQQKIADVIILGNGMIYSVNGTVSATYTFRAVNSADSQILATTTAGGELGGSPKDVVARLADEAVRALACEMLQFWNPPSQLPLKIKNMDGVADIECFAAAVRDRAALGRPVSVLGSPSFEGGQGQGIVKLVLDYRCTFEELIREFCELSNVLPFDLVVERLDRSDAVLAIARK